MDISIFNDFVFSNEEAWEDFLMANAKSHDLYNVTLEGLGLPINSVNLIDMDDSQDGRNDWLQNHNVAHQYLAATLGIDTVPDLYDVQLKDDNQFANWLQLHIQQHQLADLILNL